MVVPKKLPNRNTARVKIVLPLHPEDRASIAAMRGVEVERLVGELFAKLGYDLSDDSGVDYAHIGA